jgi:hypothetical protein
MCNESGTVNGMVGGGDYNNVQWEWWRWERESSATRGRSALIPLRDRGSLYGRRAELTYQTRSFCSHQMAVIVSYCVMLSVVPCTPHTAKMYNYCKTCERISCKSDTKYFSVIQANNCDKRVIMTEFHSSTLSTLYACFAYVNSRRFTPLLSYTF